MVTNIVEESFFTWNDLVFTAQGSKEYTQTIFDKFLAFCGILV